MRDAAESPLGLPDDERRRLVRQAWRADAPTDGEIAAGVRRIAARGGTRRRSRPRMIVLAAASLVLLAALAYAAGARRAASELPHGERTDVAGTAPRVAEGVTDTERGRTPHPTRDDAEPRGPSSPDHPRAEAGSAPAAGGTRSAERVRAPAVRWPTAPPASSNRAVLDQAGRERAAWGEVASALEAEDGEAARRALLRLDQEGSPDTRAKARLGLAHLALSRGDRPRAQALADEVAAMPGVSDALTARARHLSGRARE